MSRYTAVTDADLEQMLAAIGASSVDELFAEIPDGVRLRRALDLPAGMREQDVYAHLLRPRRAQHLRRGRAHVPRRRDVRPLRAGGRSTCCSARSEFLTPYTPYQPEISQGGLQVMFEYQTAISELTGLPVSNASVYEGPSAVGAAGVPGEARQRQARGSSSRAACTRTAARRCARSRTATAWRSSRSRSPDGATDADALGRRDRRRHLRRDLPAAELPRRGRGRRGARATPRKNSPARRRRLLRPDHARHPRPPGECGVDVAVGEGQTLGNRLDFGGPSFGFFAATEAYLRRMPGRIAGETTRRRRPPRLRAHAADARAAHPPREGDLEHLHRAGAQRARRRRLPELARPRRARRARPSCCSSAPPTRASALAALDGVDALHEQPVVREFAVDARRRRTPPRCAA